MFLSTLEMLKTQCSGSKMCNVWKTILKKLLPLDVRESQRFILEFSESVCSEFVCYAKLRNNLELQLLGCAIKFGSTIAEDVPLFQPESK